MERGKERNRIKNRKKTTGEVYKKSKRIVDLRSFYFGDLRADFVAKVD